MARSSLAAIGVAAMFLVASCSAFNAPSPVPVTTIVTPTPANYTCAQVKRMGEEFNAQPPDSMLTKFINDYSKLRDANWAALKVPPPRCIK